MSILDLFSWTVLAIVVASAVAMVFIAGSSRSSPIGSRSRT